MGWIDLTYDEAFHRDFKAAERKWRILDAMRHAICAQGLPVADCRCVIDGLTVEQTVAYAEALLIQESE